MLKREEIRWGKRTGDMGSGGNSAEEGDTTKRGEKNRGRGPGLVTVSTPVLKPKNYPPKAGSHKKRQSRKTF